jgi:hypothetical protein
MHLTGKYKHKLKVKECKKVIPSPKVNRHSILISGKADFKPKIVTRDKEGHFIWIKRTIHQE